MSVVSRAAQCDKYGMAPPPLTPWEQRERRRHATRLARELGFVGRMEYRHVYSNTGGASYGQSPLESMDLLIVYAEAFERDANPDDYSLRAIIAHECGHQILARHPRIAPRVAGRISPVGEEILASLLGAMICGPGRDGDDLHARALVQLPMFENSPEQAGALLEDLLELFARLL